MDFILSKVMKNFQESPCQLTKKNINTINKKFPVPKEHKILWADSTAASKNYGMVITNIGLFIKASPEAVKRANRNSKKEDKVHQIYHYIKWEYFDPNDFEQSSAEDDDMLNISFNGNLLFRIDRKYNFFKCYSEIYKKTIKEAAVSAENIFANLEAVIPENFSKVNTKTGHGEMAEEALTLLDKIQGKDAKVVGRTNEKNGADRIVNGVKIQTKYYSTGKGCINSCFDKTTGQLRYMTDTGKPMNIEVPKDKYAEAVNEFRKKILEGKVPGITDPNDASKFIKKGQLTYKQALNLCKPGTIESLTYDAATGAINCSFALGLTFLSAFILTYSKSGNKTEALNSAFAAGIQVFGLSFFAHVLTQQVARTALTKQLIPLSTYIAKSMGYKTVQSIVNAIRSMAGKSAISGSAAMKQLAKIIRSNVVTSIITFIVFSIPDTYNIFRKRLSTAQYTKNMLSLVGTMITSSGGTLATSLAAAKICGFTGTAIAPGVGTAIGISGGLLGGLAGAAVIKYVGDKICEDDTVIVGRLFNAIVANMIYEYMLTPNEIDVLVENLDAIKPKEFKKLFGDVISADKQEKITENYLRSYFENIIRNRPKLPEPKPEDLVEFFKQFSL